jgi:hypothetical protein
MLLRQAAAAVLYPAHYSVGIRRVVIAWREPDLVANCRRIELLTTGGVEGMELPKLAGGASGSQRIYHAV